MLNVPVEPSWGTSSRGYILRDVSPTHNHPPRLKRMQVLSNQTVLGSDRAMMMLNSMQLFTAIAINHQATQDLLCLPPIPATECCVHACSKTIGGRH